MRKYLLLLRVLIPESVRGIGESGGLRPGKKRKRASLFAEKPWLALLVSYSFIMIYSAFFGVALTGTLKLSGLEDQFVSSVAFMIPIITVIFGFMQGISSLYHESKIDFFLALPIKTGTYVAAKLTEVYLYIFITVASFFLPALLAHAIVAGRTVGFYFLILPFVIFSSIAPFAVLLIPVFVLMRFTRFARNKDRFQLISNLVFMVVIMTFALSMSRVSSQMDMEQTPGLLVPESVYSRGLRFLPSSLFADLMLKNASSWQSLWYLLLLAAVTMVCVAIMLLVAGKLYLPGVLGNKGSKAVRVLTQEEFRKALKPRSQTRALISKEWKLLLRSPTFFMQTILSSIIMPLAMILGGFVGGTAGGDSMGSLFGDQMAYLQTDAWWRSDLWIVVMVLVAAGIFFGSFNMASSTAISRQGQTFQTSKLIPAAPHRQLIAWVFPGISVSGLLWLLTILFIGTFLKFSPLLMLAATIIGWISCYTVQMAGICIDMKYPTLSWTSENQAVKNSKSAMIGMFGSMGLAGVVVALSFLLNAVTQGNSAITSAFMLAFALGLAGFFTWLARRMAAELFRHVEI
jgi:ABC-2 type transport system permease protein